MKGLEVLWIDFFQMRCVVLITAGAALADSYRVHYSISGSGRDITVQAESSAEARRTVMDMFGPRCVVPGAHRIRSKD